MNRARITVILALVVAGCSTGSAPGTQAVTPTTPTGASPTAPSPTATPTAIASVEPSPEVSPPPPSVAPAATLTGITEPDLTRIAASTGQTCTSDTLTIECQSATQSKGLQARRADVGVGLVAVTAQAYSSDTIGYAYLTKVCSLTQSYSAAVVKWIGANRAKADIVRTFGPYRVEYWGPPGRGILSIRPAG